MILKKISLAAIAMLLGLFLTDCSNNSTDEPNPNDLSTNSSSSSLDTSPSSSSDKPITQLTMSKFVAEQSPYIGNDKIKYSYSYGEYDFYYIHLGKLKNIPLFSHAARHHNGINFTYKIEITETIKNSTTETITNSSQTTIAVANEYTTSTTSGLKLTQEINAKLPIKIINAGVKATAEENWSWYTKNTTSFQQTQTTSLTNTITTGTEHTKTTMESMTWNFTKDDQIGYYRYTLFSASDIYLYVIRNSTTGEIDYEFKEYVIPSSLNDDLWVLDYSEDGNFGKSDYTGFEFDISILNNLPKPIISFEKKIVEAEYTNAGNYTYTFNEKFPATVEIYTLGAGGGGQGGNSRTGTLLPSNYYYGTGGAGGGGAAVYTKIDVNEATTFYIEVGKGGDAGGVHRITNGDAGKTGYSGGNGGNSSVKWNDFTLVAQGGNGGNQPDNNDRQTSGGAGGNITGIAYPANYLDRIAVNGNNGSSGVLDGLSGSNGGNGASISRGSLSSFGGGSGAVRCSSCWYTGEFLTTDDGSHQAANGGGGAGGYGQQGTSAKAWSNDGSPGGDGKVVIVFTYFE
jgi:hypothetical protein